MSREGGGEYEPICAQVPTGTKNSIRTLRAGVRDICEPPNMGARVFMIEQ